MWLVETVTSLMIIDVFLKKGVWKYDFFVKNKIYGIDCGISWVYISNFNQIGPTVSPLRKFEVWGQTNKDTTSLKILSLVVK